MTPQRKIIRIGTRGSLLALAQSNMVRRQLARYYPRMNFKLVVIKTTGDEYQTVELFRKNNVGVFTKELEKKLLSGSIDIAVHSLKDLPTDLPERLVLAAFPKRLDPRDVLISKKRYTLKTLPKNASVATGSPRRKQQLRIRRPDLRLFDIRGNLDTRIGRVLKKNEFDAVVLARAGLMRLNKYQRYAVALPSEQILPAVGQGALGLETRSSDSLVIQMLARLNHGPTQTRVRAERAFLRELQGGCRVPLGIDSSVRAAKLYLRARVFSMRDRHYISASAAGGARFPEKLGILLAKKLLSRGALALLKEARSSQGTQA